jgi:hypothetical protein
MEATTMMHITPNRIALVLSCFCLVLVGCERKPAAPSAADVPAILSSEESILRFIPADSPYVLVNPEPIDDELLAKMTGDAFQYSAGYESAMRDALKRDADAYPEDSAEREQAERAADVMASMLRLISLDGMRDAGFDINGSVAVYGHGLLPVVRAELLDGDAFEAAVSAIEQDADHELDTAELDGVRYRFLEDDGTRIMFGAFGDYVVLSVAPSSFTDAELRQLVGLDLPKTSLAASGKLGQIAGEYGYTSHYIGFVDTQRIAATLVEGGGELDAALFMNVDFDRSSLSEVCREEIREFAGIAPRMVFGYRKIAKDGIDGGMTIELREDIAAGLMTLPAIVPGLGIDPGAFFSLGVGIDLMAARKFYEARLDAMAKDPYACEYFAELEANAARGREALAQPVPPVVYGFRGVVAVFDDFDLSALQSDRMTEQDAGLLVAIEDAPGLVLTASMFSPELAALDIQPDGQPVELDLPVMTSRGDPPYLAMTDDSLVLATGTDSGRRIEQMLVADSKEPAPIFSAAGDAGQYYNMVGEAMSESDSQMSPETSESIRASMAALADVYDRMQLDVQLTQRGVEIDVGMTFKD